MFIWELGIAKLKAVHCFINCFPKKYKIRNKSESKL